MNVRAFFWRKLTRAYPNYLRKMYKMDIGKDCRISWKACLDKSINPQGIHIGDRTQVLNGAMILSHDACRGIIADTYIGRDCVIGVRSIILPGLIIGNQCIIGGGAVVTRSVPDNCIVAGNPAKVIKKGVVVKNGRILDGGQRV